MKLSDINKIRAEAERVISAANEAETRVLQEVEYRKKFWGKPLTVDGWENHDFNNMREISALKRSLQDIKYVSYKINNPDLYK